MNVSSQPTAKAHQPSARPDQIHLCRPGDARAARLGARRLARRRGRRGRAGEGGAEDVGPDLVCRAPARARGAPRLHRRSQGRDLRRSAAWLGQDARERARRRDLARLREAALDHRQRRKASQAREGLVGPARAQDGAPRVSPPRRRRRDHPVELSVPERHQPDHSRADGGQRHRAQAVGVGGVVERAPHRGAARGGQGRGSRSGPHPGGARLRRDRRRAGALRRRHDPVHRLGRQRTARGPGERRAGDAGGDGARRQRRVHRLRRRRSRAGRARGDERLLHQLRAELRRLRAHPRPRRDLRSLHRARAGADARAPSGPMPDRPATASSTSAPSRRRCSST